jgi:hypoxanthine phosphoribosyltransferase
MIESYSYGNRKGIKPISWTDFYAQCKGLAIEIAKYNPDIIVGIARGGLYPATQLSHMLQKELQTVRLSRRLNDEIIYKDPVWIQQPTEYVKSKKVLVVDEICDTGQTINIVKEKLESLGVAEVKTAVLYSHTQAADNCQYIGIISDELIINPWDREVLIDGQFVLHPEYKKALETQGVSQTSDFLSNIQSITPTKF